MNMKKGKNSSEDFEDLNYGIKTERLFEKVQRYKISYINLIFVRI